MDNEELRELQEKEIEKQKQELRNIEKKKIKKSNKRALIIFSCILLFFIIIIAYICIQYKIKYPGERTDFASMEEFVEYGGVIIRDAPEGASDFKYYYNKNIFQYESIYSFVISDEEEYDMYMESIKDGICNVPEGRTDEPFWREIEHSINFFNEDLYTEEEWEEMTYLEEHYLEMDYKEIWSMSDHTYGFYDGYGASVSDYIGMEDPRYNNIESYRSPYEFPMKDCFPYVIEGNLEDYRILLYDSFDGSHHGIIVDEETGRFVCFRYAVW